MHNATIRELIHHLEDNDIYSPSCCSCRRLPVSPLELRVYCNRSLHQERELRETVGEFFQREATLSFLPEEDIKFKWRVDYRWRHWWFSMDFSSFWLALWCVFLFKFRGTV